MCFVDLAKAFDTVNREFMMYKLYKYNISSKFTNIVTSLYNGLHACVRTRKGYTDSFPIELGTRQGCNLSPMLFNIFMNDLPNYLECKNSGYVRLNHYKLRCLLYADDIVLMSESQQGLQRSLDLLAAYCKGWQLVVNVKKNKNHSFP